MILAKSLMPSDGLQLICSIALIVLGIAMFLTVYRILRGPSLPDRVVALDLLAYFATGAICIYAIQFGRSSLLIVAVVMALILFLGTAAFAYYIEKRANP